MVSTTKMVRLIFISLCFVKLSVLSETSKIDQNYFNCPIINKLPEAFFTQPSKVFYVVSHPKEKNLFRYLTPNEWNEAIEKLNEIWTREINVRWYNVIQESRAINAIYESLRPLRLMILLEDKTPSVIDPSFYLEPEIAYKAFLEKITNCQKEIALNQ